MTGEALFPADLKRADFLHSRIVFTNQPHARITKLDVTAASAVPGVVDIVTAADVPVNEYGLVFRDQPVLIGPVSSGRSLVASDVSRWEADHLCLVVAETVACRFTRSRGGSSRMGRAPVAGRC